MFSGYGIHLEEYLAPFVGARTIVTGGAGAIGNNLVRQLVRQGAQVAVIDDFSSSQRENLADIEEMVSIFEGDVVDDEILEAAFKGGVDYVFHLAAFFANQNSVEHPEDDLHSNGWGTLKLLQHAVKYNARRFVFASSSCVYGGRSEILDEETPLAPDTPYAITKVLGEQYTQFFAQQHGLSTTVLRYFNSYGPGELPGRYRNVIPNFFALAAAGKPLPVTGTGEETRDFTFVEDIVHGTMLAVVKERAEGEILNLGTGSETQIGNMAEAINEIAGNNAGIIRVARRNWDHIPRRCAQIAKAKECLNYQATVSLNEGLKRYWSWYTEAREKEAALIR